MKKKKYKVWVEYEDTIEAKSLQEAINNFERDFNPRMVEFNGCEIK